MNKYQIVFKHEARQHGIMILANNPIQAIQLAMKAQFIVDLNLELTDIVHVILEHR